MKKTLQLFSLSTIIIFLVSCGATNPTPAVDIEQQVVEALRNTQSAQTQIAMAAQLTLAASQGEGGGSQPTYTFLPTYTFPPTYTTVLTPTSAARFTVTFERIIVCGKTWAFEFKFVNTGSVIFQSYQVGVYDSNTGTATTYNHDSFTQYAGCGLIHTWIDLEPGETAWSGNWADGVLRYNPAGHNLTATITLYSQDGLTGQYAQSSINFVP